MQHTRHTLVHHAAPMRSGTALTSLRTRLRAARAAWQRRRDTRLALGSLNAHLLADIGLTPEDVPGVLDGRTAASLKPLPVVETRRWPAPGGTTVIATGMAAGAEPEHCPPHAA